MFGLLTALLDLIGALIGGVLRLVTSIVGGCFGTLALAVIVILVLGVLIFGHVV